MLQRDVHSPTTAQPNQNRQPFFPDSEDKQEKLRQLLAILVDRLDSYS